MLGFKIEFEINFSNTLNIPSPLKQEASGSDCVSVHVILNMTDRQRNIIQKCKTELQRSNLSVTTSMQIDALSL